MSKYILRRLFSGILTILMVFVLDFIIIKAAPAIRSGLLWVKKQTTLR